MIPSSSPAAQAAPATGAPARRPRILWIASEYHPRVGGMERYLQQALDALSPSCDLALVTSIGQMPLPRQTVLHAGELELARPTTAEEVDEARSRLAGLVEAYSPDVVHFSGAGLAIYQAAAGDRPTVVTVFGKDFARPWQQMPGGEVRVAMATGLRACSAVLCISQFTRGLVEEAVPGLHCEVLTPGIDPSPAERVSGAPGRSAVPVVLTVARLIERKGHLQLLRAFEQVKTPFHWHVLGTGPLFGALEDRLASSPFRLSATLHGAVTDEALQQHYRQSHLFALTPVFQRDSQGLDAEGFGLVYLEAALHGVPSLASRVGGCAEAVVDGVTGNLVDPDDAPGCAAALDELLADPARLRQFGLAARHRATTQFAWADRATSLRDLYLRLSARGAAS